MNVKQILLKITTASGQVTQRALVKGETIAAQPGERIELLDATTQQPIRAKVMRDAERRLLVRDPDAPEVAADDPRHGHDADLLLAVTDFDQRSESLVLADVTVYGADSDAELGLVPLEVAGALLGLGAVAGGIAAATGGGGGGVQHANPQPAEPVQPKPQPGQPKPPTAGIVNNGNGQHEVVGTGVPGGTVTVTWPDGTTSTTTVDESGNWHTKVPGEMTTDGSVTVTETDPAGNVSQSTTVTGGPLDVTPPTAPTAGIVNNGNGQHEVVGKGEPGGTVTVTWPDGTTSTTTVDESGNWNTKVPGEMTTDGPVTVTETDPAGNVSAPTTATGGQLDVTPPTVPTAEIGNNGNGQREVVGKGEPGDTVTVTWPDGTTSTTKVDESGNWHTKVPDEMTTDGLVTVTVTDPAGNVSPPTTATGGSLDVTPPTVPTAGIVNNGNGQHEVVGKGEPGGTVTVTWPDGTTSTTTVDESGNWNTKVPDEMTTDGPVTVTVTDPAGNVSPPTTATGGTLDVTPPAAPTTAPSGYADNVGPIQNANSTAPTTDDATPGIHIGAAPAGDTPVLFVDGRPVAASYDPATGTLTPVTPLADGAHQIGYGYQDAAGNVSGSSPVMALTIDTTPPSALTAGIVNTGNGQHEVVGTGEPGDTVTVTWPDGTTSTTKVDESGNWHTKVPDEMTTDGPVTVTETDPAGNVSQSTTATGGPLDVTPPAAPTTAPSGYADNVGPIQNANSTAPTTDDATPGIHIGAAPAGDTPVLFVDGRPVAASYDPATGTLTPVTPLADGAHQIGYGYQDAAGNVSGSSPVMALTIDTTPPSALTAGIVNTGNGQHEVVGTGEPGGTVTVTWPDGTTSTTKVDESGNWHTKVPGEMTTDGSVTVTETDPAGNVSQSTTATGGTLDVTPPAVPTAEIGNNGNGQHEVVGTGEPGDTVTVTWPDGTTSTTKVDESGNWHTKVPGEMTTDGSVTVTETDPAGNVSQSTTVTGGPLDVTPPTAPTAGIVNNGNGQHEVVGKGEPGGTVTVTWPDGTTSTTTVDESGNWNTKVPGEMTTDGPVTVTETDPAGNVSPPTTATGGSLDVTPPTVPTAGIVNNGNGQHEVVGKGEPGGTVTVTWPDGTTSTTTVDESGNWNTKVPGEMTTDGPVTVTETDPAGNVSQSTTATGGPLDVTPPSAAETVRVTSISPDTGTPGDYLTNDPALVFNGTVGTTLAAGDKVQVSWDGGTSWHDAVTSGTTWSYDNTGVTLPDGAYTLQARVVDRAGNVGQSTSQGFTVDTAAPTEHAQITGISPDTFGAGTTGTASDFITDANHLRFNGTLDTALAAGEKVQVSWDGGASWQDAVTSGTTWNYDNTGVTLADGTYTLQAHVVDAVGNTGQAARQALTVDTTPPAAPTESIAVNTVTVGGLESGAAWEYSTDGGTTWTAGSGTSFTLHAGHYAAGQIQVHQSDVAGNVSANAANDTAHDAPWPTSINLGEFTWQGETHQLNLIEGITDPVTGKTYYYLDGSGDGTSANTPGPGIHQGMSYPSSTSEYTNNDRATHDWLDGLFNRGNETTDELSTRQRTINGTTLVLPSESEWEKFYNDNPSGSTTANHTPSGWDPGGYWSSTKVMGESHSALFLASGSSTGVWDRSDLDVAFQVL